MNRLLTCLALFATLLLVGCAGRPKEGLGTEAQRIHESVLEIVDALPASDPLRARVLQLADDTGRHKDRCKRVQEHWGESDGEMRNLLNGD